ncbi:membrane metallo-endopeptidase-like 1 [Copidosoma floridanum]|uniref:membrane metallo-endopeptidase-like 1 n=1 Tax=Copidosoma floridanum TaxID=29053 RepID=UPI0006C9B5E2|nr:membrane metallo-endopeptidase-like 1 [Copidosoma floridanum]XP_014211121.1 membrane metallo-endopeptidase-like 1 [Copidosoma floridanum]
MNEAMLRQLLWIGIIVASASSTTGYVAHPDFDQCDRPQCHVVDDIFMRNIRPHVEPCQDFFGYSCGRNDSRRLSYLSFISNEAYNADESTIQDLEEILVSLDEQDRTIDALKIEKEIYQKCHDVGVYTEEAKEQYKKLLRKNIGQLDQNEQWWNVDKKYAMEGLGFAFFDIDIVQRESTYNREPKRYILISPPTDSVIDMNDLLMSRYMDKLRYNPNRDSYSSYSTNVNIDNSNDYATESKNLELKKFINEFNKILPYEKFDDVLFRDDISPKPITLLEWQRKWSEVALHHAHCKLNWRNILDSLFSKIDRRIYEDEQIILVDEQYFYRLIELLRQSSSMNTIVDYINLRFVSKTIGSVVEEYKEKYSIVPPIKGLICTPGLLVGAAHVYAKQFFPRDNKETVEGIFSAVKAVIEKQLGSDNYNVQATSDATKNFLRQLSSSNVLIGYPDWLYSERFVKNFYGSRIAISEIYYVNQLRLMEVLLKHKLRAYMDMNLSLTDMKLFFKSFTDERISFSKYLNQIILPVRAFSENNFKFLSTQLYEPINYGAAGTVIASELYSVWLRRIAYDQNATQCVRHQLPAHTDEIGTNEYLLKAVAHLLGLKAAFEAWPSKDSYPIQFPKFGAVTDYRLFFHSFAESLCVAKEHKGELFQPYEFINFAVSNMAEFSEAFKCYKNHRMNRHTKCDPLKY